MFDFNVGAVVRERDQLSDVKKLIKVVVYKILGNTKLYKVMVTILPENCLPKLDT